MKQYSFLEEMSSRTLKKYTTMAKGKKAKDYLNAVKREKRSRKNDMLSALTFETSNK